MTDIAESKSSTGVKALVITLVFILLCLAAIAVELEISRSDKEKYGFGAGVYSTLSSIELETRSQELVPFQANNATVYCMSQDTLQAVQKVVNGQN